MALSLSACGDDDATPVDAGPDGADAGDVGDVGVDVVYPPGPQGDVLRVTESERWVIPELEGEVYVLRTEADVPHIYASNDHDLRVVQGFVVARDRYFQIEAGRRLAQGRLSELLGDAALSGDQDARGRGMRKIAERLVSLLTPEQVEVVDAYVAGVNAYIQAVKDREIAAPSEFMLAASVLGARRPGDLMDFLTREDLIAFAAVPVFQLGYETGDPLFSQIEAQLPDLLADDPLRHAGVLEDIWAPVAPINPVSSAAGFGLEGEARTLRLPTGVRHSPSRRSPSRRPTPRDVRPSAEPSMLQRLLARNDEFERRHRGGRWNDFGSNSWAIRGEHAADGAAILSGDGHLPLSIAPLFFQLGLDTSVFGEGETTLMGLFFAAIPPMAVGTNGRVAWSQTYLRGDVTDWYGEQLVLDASGAPRASIFFEGATPMERPLVVVDESYDIAGVLGSVERSETWKRFETFDGRVIAAIEGTVYTLGDPVPSGRTVVNVQGDYVLPQDVDGDGVVSAISFDYTGFDVSNILRALQGFNDADNVHDFREASRELVVYAQNLVAADTEGSVYYGSYNGMPSRAHLPKDGEGEWLPGANPRGLIDGTRYPAFEVPLDADGIPDESQCATDASKCLVPFDRWPAALNPDRGFVLTANNDIANITTDDDFTDDEFYIGGPWNNGYRAQTIETRLTELAADDSASLEAMQALQNNHDSVLGRDFGPFLLEALDEAKRIATDGPVGEAETRLQALYMADASGYDEVATRVRAWIDRGANAASGVETFYDSPDADDRSDAVATMLFNSWWRDLVRQTFDDEGIEFVFGPDPRTMITRTLHRMWNGRGAGNPLGLAAFDPATGESAFFDRLGTPAVETSLEVAIMAMRDALGVLRSAPIEPGIGGFGTADMDQWLWGLRHQVKFESIINDFVGDDPAFRVLANGFSVTPRLLPLAPDLPDEDPRAELPWFPRPGDMFNVDAAHYSFDGPDYFYSNGPVMRMVIRLEEGAVRGVNILPGGQSGRKESEHFTDQAALWLGNDTIPVRFTIEDVLEGATSRETYAPE